MAGPVTLDEVNFKLDSRTFGLILVAAAWAVFLAVIGSPEVLLFTAPFFLLAAPLALGSYVGEELVARLARAAQPFNRRQGFGLRPDRARTRVFVPGSLIIASNLAGRAPPAAPA